MLTVKIKIKLTVRTFEIAVYKVISLLQKWDDCYNYINIIIYYLVQVNRRWLSSLSISLIIKSAGANAILLNEEYGNMCSKYETYPSFAATKF